ncbi:MAG: hypothetical protein U5Q16_08650 [Gammaproteobacteria bacterium]|nr:hypothetical protein [Gammaproteobacteria bacterium]
MNFTLLDIGDLGSVDIAASCVRTAQDEDEARRRPPGIVAVWVQNDDGDFDRQQLLTTWRPTAALAAGDLDGDYEHDLAVVAQNPGTRGVAVFLNNGDGSFDPEPITHRMSGAAAEHVIFHDTAHTERMDLIVTGSGYASGMVLTNQGPDSYERFSEALFLPDEKGLATAVHEMSGDTEPDLAVTQYRKGRISLFAGGLDDTLDVSLGKSVRSAAEVIGGGDFNGNRVPDLVLLGRADDGAAPVYLALSESPQAWSITDPLAGVTAARQAFRGDFDSDGAVDLVLLTDAAMEGDASHADIFMAAESGGDVSYQPAGQIPLAEPPHIALAADMRNQGHTSLVVGNRDSGRITVHTWQAE